VTLYFVRHAKAGDRSKWDGADIDRPLSRAGWKQATKLCKRLAPRTDLTVLVSSPYVRCVQTLEPLAAACGRLVQTDDRLLEGGTFEGALELLGELPDGAVLCSHGDVIPDTMQALVRRGLDVRSRADWRKASVWVIERNNKGRFTQAVCWPPPGSSPLPS
jgi:8-oxo-dGTP diphosphatase